MNTPDSTAIVRRFFVALQRLKADKRIRGKKTVTDRYGINPGKTLYIDDVEANVRAGAEIGLRVWHYAGDDRGA